MDGGYRRYDELMTKINQASVKLKHLEADERGHTEGAIVLRNTIVYGNQLKDNYLEAVARVESQAKSNDSSLQILVDADFDSFEELKSELLLENAKLAKLEDDDKGDGLRATKARDEIGRLVRLQEQYLEAVAQAEAAAAAKESKSYLQNPNDLLAANDYDTIADLESELLSENAKLAKLEGEGKGDGLRATKARDEVDRLMQLQDQYLEAVAKVKAVASTEAKLSTG